MSSVDVPYRLWSVSRSLQICCPNSILSAVTCLCRLFLTLFARHLAHTVEYKLDTETCKTKEQRYSQARQYAAQ